MGFLRRYFDPSLSSQPPEPRVQGRLIASSDPAINRDLRAREASERRHAATQLKDGVVVSVEPVHAEGRIIATYAPPELEKPPKLESEPPPNALTLSRDLRMRHLYIVGKSGTGKTTLLKHLLSQNFNAGDGSAFLDPHGDAAYELLGLVPASRLDDVIYFDPTSRDAPAFNLLALAYEPAKLTADIVGVFELLFGSSWGPQLEQLLRNGLLLLLTDHEPHALNDLQKLFTRADYRDELTRRNPEESLRDFWEHTFPTLPKGAANPVLNKLSALLVPTSHLERVFSSTSNALDFPAIMDDGRIFIANLAKGKLGDDPSRLLGALLTTALEQAALGRADAKRTRRDFFLYVDEFQNYATESFSTILSEARKYNLSLTLANQTLSQLPSSLRAAIFGNVATLVAFQVSADDAGQLGREMHATTTRMYCREKGTSRVLDAAVKIDELRASLPESIRACQLSPETATLIGNPKMMSARDVKWWTTHLKESQDTADKHASSLDFLTREARPSLEALRDNLRDYEWYEETVTTPSADDFLNLKPLRAFVRIERAENVSELTVPLPPRPDTAIRAQILARHTSRARPITPPPAPLELEKSPELEQPTPRASPSPEPAPKSRRDKYSF